MADEGASTSVELAIGLTAAWLGNQNNRVVPDDVPALLQRIHQTIMDLTTPAAAEPIEVPETEVHTPAVSVRKSLASRDRIISLIDGKPYRILKRHLSANGLTPDQYRKRYGLKADYPMIAPSYSEARSAEAKRRGIGGSVVKQVEQAAEIVAGKVSRGGKAALAAARKKLGTAE